MADQKRKIIFSLPAKTFLVGEYAVADGGAAVVLATEPRFKISLAAKNLSREARWQGFGEAGPGYKYLLANRALFREFDVEFIRPPGVVGGIGASSAEYAGVYLLRKWLLSADHDPKVTWDVQNLLEEYRAKAWSGKGMPPSGADVVGQIVGGMSYVHPAGGGVRELNWSFADLGFLLLATGYKLATHEHLEAIFELDLQDMKDCVDLVAGALTKSDSNTLVMGINDYAEMLRFRNLVARPTLDLISEAFHWPGVCAAKGCGALGADVLLVVYERRYQAELVESIQKANKLILASDQELSDGWRREGSLPLEEEIQTL